MEERKEGGGDRAGALPAWRANRRNGSAGAPTENVSLYLLGCMFEYKFEVASRTRSQTYRWTDYLRSGSN